MSERWSSTTYIAGRIHAPPRGLVTIIIGYVVAYMFSVVHGDDGGTRVARSKNAISPPQGGNSMVIVTPLDFASKIPSSQATMANVEEVISGERIARYEAHHGLTFTTYDFEFTASYI